MHYRIEMKTGAHRSACASRADDGNPDIVNVHMIASLPVYHIEAV